MASVHYDVYRRLESAPPHTDLDRGFQAEVADPLWLLGKQWLLGEHQGEDASSPIRVDYVGTQHPVDLHAGNPALNPQVIPPEAIVESEPDDWWTPGRRIRLGKLASASLPALANADTSLLLKGLPTPYQRLDGKGYDGLALYQRRAELGLAPAVFAEVPATAPEDLWSASELAYETRFDCAGRTLQLERHSGGDIDWYSVDANGTMPVPAPLPPGSQVFVNRLSFPGAPPPRWWQIEDHAVDIGGFPPDRSHFATMLLLDLIASHGDNWFGFPVPSQLGHVISLHQVRVTDSFGDVWTLQTPTDWSLFQVTGLDKTSLLLWATATNPLTGPVLEEVALGVDEDANVLWAVEKRVGGNDLPSPARPAFPDEGQPVASSARKAYSYLPSSPFYPYWHPYQIAEVGGRRRFVQGRLADLDNNPPKLLPEPQARVLADPKADPNDPAQQIEPATIPSQGLGLERRALLARGVDGLPVLWTQRRRLPLLAPPALRLEFDLLGETFVET
jgi:hypothetical protein